VCKAFIDDTGVKTWEEAEEKFPSFASAEASDQFVMGNNNKMINSNRRCTSKYLLKGFCTLQDQRNSVSTSNCTLINTGSNHSGTVPYSMEYAETISPSYIASSMREALPISALSVYLLLFSQLSARSPGCHSRVFL
jgi:hypothetical protein